MNTFFIYFLFLFQIKKLKGRSDEFNECINLSKTITDPSDCLSIKIPDNDGYKCCSMKITYNNNSSYSCFALETNYTTNQTVLNKYISEINISSLFNSYGGEMEINCGDNLKIEENYKKLSDEYLNCYNNHIKGIENENNCTNNDIPSSEGSKCCFVETSSKSQTGNIINDKRCYIIQDKYFTENKNLKNFLLDESNNNLDEYNNVNITINCKNYGIFFYSGFDKSIKNTYSSDNIQETEIIDETRDFQTLRPKPLEESGIKAWVIILIILGAIIFIGIIILIVFLYLRRNKKINK